MCLKAGWAAFKIAAKIKDWKTIQYFHVWNFNGDTFLDFFETLCGKIKNTGLFVVRGKRVCKRPSTFNNVHLVSITWQSDIIVLNEPWMLCYIHWLIVLYAQSAFKVFGLENRQLRPIHKTTFLSCSFFSHWRYVVEFSRKPIFTFFKVEPSFVFFAIVILNKVKSLTISFETWNSVESSRHKHSGV